MCVLSGTVLSVLNQSHYITLVSCCSDTHCTQVMRCVLGLRLVTIFPPTLGTLYPLMRMFCHTHSSEISLCSARCLLIFRGG